MSPCLLYRSKGSRAHASSLASVGPMPTQRPSLRPLSRFMRGACQRILCRSRMGLIICCSTMWQCQRPPSRSRGKPRSRLSFFIMDLCLCLPSSLRKGPGPHHVSSRSRRDLPQASSLAQKCQRPRISGSHASTPVPGLYHVPVSSAIPG